jgi:uncharacterized protein YdaU (DUF1376 family)
MGIFVNYYSFHIGDYAAHTRNLSLLEDLAYRRLLDAYYLAERPLNGCATDVAREIGMREHTEEVAYVLGKFFEWTEAGWVSKRAEKEIAHFSDKKQKASEAGKASAQRRINVRSTSVQKEATSVEVLPTGVQPTNNQEPITINTPIPPAKTPGAQSPKPAAAVSLPAWLATVKAKGEKPIPDDDPVFDYAEQANITMDLMRLCWVEFRARYSEPNSKRYKDWRSVYRKAVRGNWLKLWFLTEDGYGLTTAGQQAQRALEAKQGIAA